MTAIYNFRILVRAAVLVLSLAFAVGCGATEVAKTASEKSHDTFDKGESATGYDKPVVDVPVDATTMQFEHDGVMREALLYVPASYEPDGQAALMLNFHGFGGSAAGHFKDADMRSLADRDGALLAYPQGSLLDGFAHWNAALDSPDNKSEADDLGFVRELAAQIAIGHPFDRNRLYASGYSNGGMMAFALACYESDFVAAVAVVSGVQLDDSASCAPSHATAVITLHGTNDTVLPYEGNGETLSAQDAVDFWISANNAASVPATASDTDRGVTIERFSYEGAPGGVAVEHYRYVGGGHVWPVERFNGADASELVWEFVTAYEMLGTGA